MTVEPLIIDRCWTTQDGVVMALAVTAQKLGVSLSLPHALPPGARIQAERRRDGWRFVEAAASGAEP